MKFKFFAALCVTIIMCSQVALIWAISPSTVVYSLGSPPNK